jgi:hypothetical protein
VSSTWSSAVCGSQLPSQHQGLLAPRNTVQKLFPYFDSLCLQIKALIWAPAAAAAQVQGVSTVARSSWPGHHTIMHVPPSSLQLHAVSVQGNVWFAQQGC